MDEQAQRIRRRMVAFVEAKDIAASEGLTEAELDALCSIQFGMTLPEAVERFTAEGRAQILEAQVAAAMDGSNQMLTLLGERYLGQGEKFAQSQEGVTALAEVLSLVGDTPDSKSRAAH